MTATATKRQAGRGTRWSVGELLSLLKRFDKVVQKRPLRPILASVLFRDGRIIASSGTVQVDYPLAGEATMLLPYLRLKAILDSCPREAEVRFTAGKASCRVECEKASWALPTESADEFPILSCGDAAPFFRVPADQFRRMTAAVTHAVDTSRAEATVLRSVCFDVLNGEVTLAATDGRALATAEAGIDQSVDNKVRLVPVEAVEAMRTFADGEGAVQLEASTTAVVCTIQDGAVVTASLVSGAYPRWRDIVPDADRGEQSVVEKQVLINALKSARVCSDEASRGVTLTFSEKGLRLHSKSATAGEASVTCDLTEFGQAATVKLDPAYVLAWLDHLPADGDPMICIDAASPEDRVVFRSDDFLAVIAPLA